MKTAIDRKKQAKLVLAGLRKAYPDAHIELDFKNPLELAVATILSAQCTDKRVNIVTKDLFKKYRTAADYAKASLPKLEADVRPTGFFRSKARSIQEFSRAVLEKHGGRVPDNMKDLLLLRGVARKTANVILGAAYGKAEGIAVDTHVKRVAFRLDLTDEKDPVKIEKDLMDIVPRQDWIYFTHGIIWHGRRCCFARSPNCPECVLNKMCPKKGV